MRLWKYTGIKQLEEQKISQFSYLWVVWVLLVLVHKLFIQVAQAIRRFGLDPKAVFLWWVTMDDTCYLSGQYDDVPILYPEMHARFLQYDQHLGQRSVSWDLPDERP